MPMLELTQEEWQTLTMVLTKQPWDIANPLLYKMAQQGRMMGNMADTASPAVIRKPIMEQWKPDGGEKAT